jgi:putative heme-binding domain-containing protein
VKDPALQAQLYPKLVPLLEQVPAELRQQKAPGLPARYVRIELPGKERTLNLVELQVLRSDGTNLELNGVASQSGVAQGATPDRAIDGRTDGSSSAGTMAQTPPDQANPWFEVDLGFEQPLHRVVVWNRTDSGMGVRMQDFTIQALDRNRKVVFSKTGNPAPSPSLAILVEGEPLLAIRRAAIEAISRIAGKESEQFQRFAALVQKDVEPGTTLLALSRQKRDQWPKQELPALGQALLRYASSVPTAHRVNKDYASVLELGRHLGTNQTAAEGTALLRALRKLDVQVITIRTIEEQMRYDVSRFNVERGRPVEIVFENPDIMQHNILVVKPGAMKETGQAADAMGGAGFAKHFIPDNGKVLFASRLIGTRTTDRVRFNAPEEPGDYPYLCTFPGHWILMNGVMKVVSEDDASIGEVVRTSLKSEGHGNAAELLQLRGTAEGGRAAFIRACAICHKVGNEGMIFGPDLSNVGTRMTKAKILESILDPNAEIAKGNESLMVELRSGETFTGLVAGETRDELKLRIGGDTVQTIAKDQIKTREALKGSGMPAGLDQTLSQQELVDLLEFLSQQK